MRAGLTAGPRWRVDLLALAAVGLAALGVWRAALGTFFTSDDLVAMARAAGLEPTPPTFRPLSAVLAARLQFAAFGLAPAGYHAVNLGLHLLAAAGVYALALRLSGARGTAAAAALIFACSGLAFTPLHAASGIGDVLACALLLAATLVHLEGRRRDRAPWLWSAAAIATAAALAKESAIAWPLVVIALEWRGARRWRAALPALAAGIVSAAWLAIEGQVLRSEAYALSLGPGHLAINLATYLRWCAEVGTPMRDAVAAADPASWPAALAVLIAVALAIRWERREPGHPIEAGALWLLAFLFPALPLAHHTYLYYLYIPWAGGAIALAAAGSALVRASRQREGRVWRKLPEDLGTLIALLGLTAFLIAEARAVALREQMTFDALPADRTLREATLLEHSLMDLRAASLPPGTPVGFVNPVPRAAFQLPGETPEDGGGRTEYIPLEAVLRGGRAFRLFAPGLIDSGFAVTIPAGWLRVECFLYEQRGWLRSWGHGQQALTRQGEFQAAAGRWAEAESSFALARSLGDTLPAAICGQAVALVQIGRARDAAALADTFSRRWPGDPRVPILHAALIARGSDPRLIQPFDPRLRAGAER